MMPPEPAQPITAQQIMEQATKLNVCHANILSMMDDVRTDRVVMTRDAVIGLAKNLRIAAVLIDQLTLRLERTGNLK